MLRAEAKQTRVRMRKDWYVNAAERRSTCSSLCCRIFGFTYICAAVTAVASSTCHNNNISHDSWSSPKRCYVLHPFIHVAAHTWLRIVCALWVVHLRMRTRSGLRTWHLVSHRIQIGFDIDRSHQIAVSSWTLRADHTKQLRSDSAQLPRIPFLLVRCFFYFFFSFFVIKQAIGQ